MLDQLVETIENLKSRIAQHRDYIAELEPRTRTQLIDPLLTALGWDVADPLLVQIEPRVIDGWADYALMGGNGRRVLAYVEAKKLGDRRDPVGQVVTYAVRQNVETGAGVQFCITTNGDRWVIYDVFSQKQLVDVSVVTNDAEECAFKLLSLWNRSFSDGKLNTVKPPIFDGEPEGVGEPSGLGEVNNGNPPPDDDLRPFPSASNAPKNSAPKAVLLDKDEEQTGGSWRGTLIATATLLVRANTLPVEASSKIRHTFLLTSRDGKHRDGSAVRGAYPLPNGIYLATHGDTYTIASRAHRLLELSQTNLDRVKVRY